MRSRTTVSPSVPLGSRQHRGLGFQVPSGSGPQAASDRSFRRPKDRPRSSHRGSYPRRDQPALGRGSISVARVSAPVRGETRVHVRSQSSAPLTASLSSARRVTQYWVPKSSLIYLNTESPIRISH